MLRDGYFGSLAPILDGAGPAYVAVGDVAEPLERVEAFGGSVVHPVEAWAICKDSEGALSGWRRSLSKGRSGPIPRPRAVAAGPRVDAPGSE